MFKKIGIVVLILIAAILVLAATQPPTFRVERQVSITATPEKIMGFVADFRQWEVWSPWEKLDPAMKRTFSGAANGKGAVYEWSGNGDVGSGRMEIAAATPASTTIDLLFMSPMESRNTMTFALAPQGASTSVLWSMEGPMSFISKVMCVFVSMDKMIGKDFEKGLADLKVAAEKA